MIGLHRLGQILGSSGCGNVLFTQRSHRSKCAYAEEFRTDDDNALQAVCVFRMI